MRAYLLRQTVRECFHSLSKKECMLFYTAAIVCIISAFALAVTFAATYTIRVPADGGSYTEAVVGGPRFINPALAPANDVDRDIAKLVFSGLLRYDENGRLMPDLAESYSVSTDSKTFAFALRENATWHDGARITVDDVLFTVRLFQNAEYQSPWRMAWQNVSVEKRGERTIIFTLTNPYAPFLSYATVGILPKHLWQDVSPQGFGLSDLNLKPVGSGPYRFAAIEREKNGAVTSLTLKTYGAFYRTKPHLEEMRLKFFESREDAIALFTDGGADGISLISVEDLLAVAARKDAAVSVAKLPRIFAVFFNQNRSKPLAQSAVREALDYATDRVALIASAYAGKADALFGPLPQSVFGYTDAVTKRAYDQEKAVSLLEKAGWKTGEDGVRILKEKQKVERVVKNKKALEEISVTSVLDFSLLTANLPELEKTANLLKEQWERVGARVDVEIAGVADIQGERVRPRLYDAVLFGEVLGLDPDPYAFWHSSQKRDPGMNLALYHNPKVDKLLEEARQTSDRETRAKKLAEFQKIVSNDIPAIFLVSPHHLYAISRRVRGVDTDVLANPSERFGDVTNWYVKTKRVWR